jgi:hypothetical protein
MSEEDATQRAEAVPVPEARSGWSEQDRRTLIITFAGGLAANLATVIPVGAAIALVRLRNYHGSEAGEVAGFLVFGLFIFALGNAARQGRDPLRAGPMRRTDPADPSVSLRRWGWLMAGLGTLLMLLAVLILTGLAAGVK